MGLRDHLFRFFFKGQIQRIYDAASSDNFRPVRGDGFSGDAVIANAGTSLRNYARYLDENHDLAVSVLDDLTNNIIGDGVSVAPMVKRADGKLDESINNQIADLWDEWSQFPDVTGAMGWLECERLGTRTWLRDGELFSQHVTSNQFNYQTRIPYALEMMEPDFCPLDYTMPDQGIIHGVQLDAWRRPLAYYFYKNHPGDYGSGYSFQFSNDTKKISADQIIHERFVRRLHQVRGVSIFHAVLHRLRDIKDYEESERIAAKVASEMTGFIQRSDAFQGGTLDNVGKKRGLKMKSGAIFELLPGESVGTIGHDRPNSNLGKFRDAMLRAVAGGTGTRYSSVTKNYDGTYSAQRQELVEGVIGYRALFKNRVRNFYRPSYERFIISCLSSGLLRIPRGINPASIARADFRAPALPWIDPAKEAKAWQILLDAKLESHAEIIRQRGRDPSKVREEIEQEMESGLYCSQIDDSVPASDDTGVDDQDEQDDDQAKAGAA